MAQTVKTGQVTPADELRESLAFSEKRVADVFGGGDNALALLKELDRIAALWPVLEAQGMDLRPEAGRWETLQATVNRRAGAIVSDLPRTWRHQQSAPGDPPRGKQRTLVAA